MGEPPVLKSQHCSFPWSYILERIPPCQGLVCERCVTSVLLCLMQLCPFQENFALPLTLRIVREDYEQWMRFVNDLENGVYSAVPDAYNDNDNDNA